MRPRIARLPKNLRSGPRVFVLRSRRQIPALEAELASAREAA